MKKQRFWQSVLPLLFFSFYFGCGLLNSDQKKTLEFEKMEVEYHKFGGWINTSKLHIQPSGELSAKLIAHASNKILRDTTSTLTGAQRERLANSFSSFTHFKRHYSPEQYMTDGNIHQIILTYNGVADTVSIYMPDRAALPKNLAELIENLDKLHHSIIEFDN